MKYTKEYLQELVNKASRVWDVVEMAGMSKQEGNYTYILKLLKKYDIDRSHFIRKKSKQYISRPLEYYLKNDGISTVQGNDMKKKLYKAGLKTPYCEFCGQGEIWRGKKISLILDHIDGIRYNNELSNLRILCPNCNATLDTHCGKNNKTVKIPFEKKSEHIEYYNEDKLLKLKKLIEENSIDVNEWGLGNKLSEAWNLSPQCSLRIFKKYFSELIKPVNYKYKNIEK